MNVRMDYRGEEWFSSKEGRFLGILDAEQFAALRKDSKNLARKVASMGTKRIMKVKSDKVKGNRLVIAVKDGVKDELFVSAVLKRVKSMTTSNADLTGDYVEFEDIDGSEIIVKETSKE